MKSEDYQEILNQYLIIDQDDKPYVTLKGVELVLKMHETEVKKLHKPNVSGSLPSLLIGYQKWKTEHNEDYQYDEIHEFFTDYNRGDIKNFMDWVLANCR